MAEFFERYINFQNTFETFLSVQLVVSLHLVIVEIKLLDLL